MLQFHVSLLALEVALEVVVGKLFLKFFFIVIFRFSSSGLEDC